MKKIIFALCMVISLACDAQTFFTGNDLLRKIESANTVENVGAYNYLMGIADAEQFHYLINRDSKTGKTPYAFFCLPGGVTAGQLKDVVKLYMNNNPAERHWPAVMIVNTALREIWPCSEMNPSH